MTSTAPVTSGTVAVPDGTLYYEVRGSGPLLALVGAPMDHGPFGPVAELLAVNHTVLVSDSRGGPTTGCWTSEPCSTPTAKAST
jgi:hypothetical protein